MRIAFLHLHVDRFVVVFRVQVDGQVEALRIGARKTGVFVRAPLHRRAHSVAVAEINVFAHADFIAVINDRRAGQGKEQRAQQLDPFPVVADQRRQTAADAQIQAAPVDMGVHAVHVIALLVGHHFQGQFIVIAQEQRPLGGLGNRRGLLQYVHDGNRGPPCAAP